MSTVMSWTPLISGGDATRDTELLGGEAAAGRGAAPPT